MIASDIAVNVGHDIVSQSVLLLLSALQVLVLDPSRVWGGGGWNYWDAEIKCAGSRGGVCVLVMRADRVGPGPRGRNIASWTVGRERPVSAGVTNDWAW